MEEFFKAAAPYLFANLLTVALVYSFVSYDRMQARGEHESGAGLMRLGYIIFCAAVLLYGLIVYGALEATPLRHLFPKPVAQSEQQVP
jgi:hypothetical protein